MQLNIAATWSKSAAYHSGYVPGREAKILSQAVLLAPRVNILRDPWKGNFLAKLQRGSFLECPAWHSSFDSDSITRHYGQPKTDRAVQYWGQ